MQLQVIGFRARRGIPATNANGQKTFIVLSDQQETAFAREDVPGLAIVKTGGEWNVIHLESGKMIVDGKHARIRRKDVAAQVLGRLGALCDWTQDSKDISRHTNQEAIDQAFKEI